MSPRIGLLGFLAATCIALFTPIPKDWLPGWHNKLFDLGHVPLFALLVIVAYRAMGRVWSSSLLALCVAVVAELAQGYVGRSTSMFDLLNGAVGILMATCWLTGRRERWWRRRWQLAAMVGLLLVPIADATPAFGHTIWAHQAFPTLCDFRAPWQTVNWEPRQSRLYVASTDTQSPTRAGCLEFRPGASPYSGAVFRPEVTDWSKYQRLCVDFHFNGQPLRLNLSVRDRRLATPRNERFDMSQTFPPGQHELCIELDRIASAPASAPLDLRRVSSLTVWTQAPERTTSIYITNIRLE